MVEKSSELYANWAENGDVSLWNIEHIEWSKAWD